MGWLTNLFRPRGVDWPIHGPSPQVQPSSRRIETEHFLVTATRREPGKLWRVEALPLSVAARYWAQSMGEPLEARMPLDHLPSYVSHLHANLQAHWGPALDSHRKWATVGAKERARAWRAE